jgi:hypothetical protein
MRCRFAVSALPCAPALGMFSLGTAGERSLAKGHVVIYISAMRLLPGSWPGFWRWRRRPRGLEPVDQSAVAERSAGALAGARALLRGLDRRVGCRRLSRWLTGCGGPEATMPAGRAVSGPLSTSSSLCPSRIVSPCSSGGPYQQRLSRSHRRPMIASSEVSNFAWAVRRGPWGVRRAGEGGNFAVRIGPSYP